MSLVKGKLTVAGKTFQLTASTNKNYPVAEGWFEYKPNSFIQVSGNDIKVETIVGTTVVPVTVTKPEPVSAIGKSIVITLVLYMHF